MKEKYLITYNPDRESVVKFYKLEYEIISRVDEKRPNFKYRIIKGKWFNIFISYDSFDQYNEELNFEFLDDESYYEGEIKTKDDNYFENKLIEKIAFGDKYAEIDEQVFEVFNIYGKIISMHFRSVISKIDYIEVPEDSKYYILKEENDPFGWYINPEYDEYGVHMSFRLDNESFSYKKSISRPYDPFSPYLIDFEKIKISSEIYKELNSYFGEIIGKIHNLALGFFDKYSESSVEELWEEKCEREEREYLRYKREIEENE